MVHGYIAGGTRNGSVLRGHFRSARGAGVLGGADGGDRAGEVHRARRRRRTPCRARLSRPGPSPTLIFPNRYTHILLTRVFHRFPVDTVYASCLAISATV